MFRTIKKFRKVLNRHQTGRVIVLLVMMTIASGFNVLGVGMMLPLMTAVMNKNVLTENAFASWLAGLFHVKSNIGFVTLCIFLMIIIYVLKDLYTIFETYIQNRFVSYNRYSTQRYVLKVYMSRPYEFFLYSSSGEIVRVIQQDIQNVYRLLNIILYFFSELFIAIGLIIAIFIINPFITSIVAGVMLLTVAVIILVIKPKMRKEGEILNSSTTATNDWILRAINGIKEIKISDNEAFFQSQFDKFAQKAVRSDRKYTVWQNIPLLLIEMTSVSSVLIAFLVELMQGVEMQLLITQLSAFVMAASRLLPAANRIANASNSIAYYGPALDKLLSVFSNRDGDNALSLSKKDKKYEAYSCGQEKRDTVLSFSHSIGLKGISYSYPNSEREVLIDASMDIPIGSSVGIVGTSGSGKTTSVDILLGLLIPKKGYVYTDGVDVTTNYKSWLRHIGYIPQSIFMFDDTIRENVVFGSLSAASDKNDKNLNIDALVWKALEEAQLADFVRSLPEGLDTEIGERGVRLSGGQRQRIGIARALYSSPDILVFDEATSSLDNETEAAIMESINALHGKKTLIIIAHRLTTIEGCDIVYRVEGGKIERER